MRGRTRCRSSWVGVLALGAALLAAPAPRVRAEAIRTPRLDSVFPLGAKAGTDVELTITGDALEGAQQLLFSHPSVTASPMMTRPDRFYPQPRPEPNHFTVHVGADVPPGPYEVRLATRLGVSNARCFFVGSAPELTPSKFSTERKDALEVAPGSVVNGSCEAQKSHFYRLPAKKGQRLILHCAARQADTKTDSVLTFYDPSAKVLRDVHDPVRVDPTLDVTVPADGDYAVSVHDFLYRGGPEYGYRLSISTGPWIEFIDPPFAVAGSVAEYTLYGRNLPGSAPAEGVSIGGESLEALKVTIEAPADPSKVPPPLDSPLRPADSSVDSFAWQLVTPAGPSNAVRLALVTGAVTREQEPNDKPEQAQLLALPAQVISRFFPRNDRDWYSFAAKKGDKLWIEVTSERLGLPTDPVMLVQQVGKDSSGKDTVKDLIEADDQIERGDNQDRRSLVKIDDPGILFTAPEDAMYRVLVRDLYNQVDPRLFYMLSIRPARCDFALLVYPARQDPESGESSPFTTVLRKGGAVPVEVMALRRDGYAGEIRLTAESLPPGVTAAPAVIGPGTDTGSLVFEAAPDAANWTGAVRIVGRAAVDGVEVARAARPFEVTWRPTSNEQHPLTRVVREAALAVRDDLPPPFSLRPAQDKVWRMARGGKLQVPLAAKRGDGAKSESRLDVRGLPQQIRSQQGTLDASATEKTIELDVDPSCATGTYSFNVRAATKVSYARNPEVAAQAAQDKKRIDDVYADDARASQEASQARQRAEQSAQEAASRANQAEQKCSEAEAVLSRAEAGAREAAARSSEAKQAAAGAAESERASRQAAAEQAAKQVDDLAAKAKAASEALAEAVRARAEAARKSKAAAESLKDAAAAETRARDEARKSDEARQLAGQRAQQAAEASRARDVKLLVPTPPIAIEIVELPFKLSLDTAELTLKPGGDLVPLTARVEREFGFDDELRFEVQPPPGAGGVQVVDKSNAVPKGQGQGALLVKADPGATPGTHTFTLRVRYRFNNRDFTSKQPLRVTIARLDPKP